MSPNSSSRRSRGLKSDKPSNIYLDLEPVTVRCFTTNTSSSAAPGDTSFLVGLFSAVRQTSNFLDWQDDDRIRCNLPAFAPLRVGSLTGVNKEAVRENLAAVRVLTGFTWDELATLLGVDRRSLHNWSQGGPVRPANQLRLAELLRVLRLSDRGSPEANRLALSAPDPLTGTTGLDLLSAERFTEAQRLLGKDESRTIVVSHNGV